MSISKFLKDNIMGITQKQLEQFELYYKLLIDYNENKCNLTAITDEEGVALKHFADSILPESLIFNGAKCIDVGTGAGFPGIPLKIMRPDIELVMVDSLNKRIEFLNYLMKNLDIDAKAIHARAEDAGRDINLREQFDFALTRAVSQTNILLEWTSPLLKVGGQSLMYKSLNAEEELNACSNALIKLNLSAEVKHFDANWGERVVIIATKNNKTPSAYPRKAGTAKKNPL